MRYSVKQQSGSTLLITLVILLLTTMAALSIFTNSIIGQKSTANYVDANYAYQEADSQLFALLDAPRGRWARLVPKRDTDPAATIPSFNTGGQQPTSTITMAYIASKVANFQETGDLNEVGLRQISYDTRAEATFGRARAIHKMISIAELPPLSGTQDTDPFR